MLQKNAYTLLILIWITVLTIWAVNKIVVPLNNNDFVTVQGNINTPQPSKLFTVQMDEKTVWIIDPYSDQITVITQDSDGYHKIQSTMQ